MNLQRKGLKKKKATAAYKFKVRVFFNSELELKVEIYPPITRNIPSLRWQDRCITYLSCF